jgi:1,4-dihydroxy-2-naphthoate octaprenyltransferase
MARIALWWRAVRPFAFTVSVIPPILGSLIAVSENPGLKFNWFHFFLTLIGCMIAHSGANLLSDYYDFRKGVDRLGTLGSSGVLVERLMRPQEVLYGALAADFMASLIGAYFIFSLPNGIMLFWIILVGAVLSFFYTAKPFALKYHGLGDIAVFVSFGPAMTLGAYFVQTHRLSWSPILYALPIAFLVDAILHSNNLRDIQNDTTARISTVAILLAESRAKWMYYLLLGSAYLSILVLIFLTRLPWLSLLTLLTLPLATKLIKMVSLKGKLLQEQFAFIDTATAQLHSAFGALMIVSLLAHHLLYARV